MKRTAILSLSVPSVILAFAVFPLEKQKTGFHTAAELAFFYQQLPSHGITTFGTTDPESFLLIDSNILFPTAKLCSGCHGYDPNEHALVTSEGKDVNIYDDWRSTMMANSARDPFWRAKVTHEILVNPAHSTGLQDKCTSCHAPSGHYQAKLHDHKPYYLLADLYADTLGLDGVNCQMCHAQSPKQLGDLHSGQLHFDTNFLRVAYGPYEMFFAPPMHQFVGITPLYGEHILDAGLCAGCHTLITETVDLAGQYTGGTFVEQATYHEWLNSRYDDTHDNISCQGCHVPQLQDEIIISTNYQFLTPKYPFGLHELAGANTMMLKLLKENREALGITAKPEHFDSTIAATLRMLQQKTLDLTLVTGVLHGDSAHFSVKLSNKAGHKFPSGYPSRRAWIEFEVHDQAGNLLFHSGAINPDYSLAGEDANFEPHHHTINDPGQIQIYELVPGDVNGQFTNVLERGHNALKDNRLVPQGFSLSDPVYDTTQVVGAALGDPDFDLNGGSDAVHYSIPVNGYTGMLTVRAKVWYQSLPPKWMAPMFEYSSPEIDSFRVMFDAADRAPVLVAERVLDSVFVSPVKTKNIDNEGFVKIFPTLSRDGKVFLRVSAGVRVSRVQVWDVSGKLVWDKPAGDELLLPEKRGTYFISVATNQGRVVEKVVRE
ncbi:MAG: T9SS type A sorting domain-containing protein [Lewinellaceae bacterium]|nr:T9SS type A sorting domain-containing protein [Lewinellaceae bacterium]